jgi:hypothetical protein
MPPEQGDNNQSLPNQNSVPQTPQPIPVPEAPIGITPTLPPTPPIEAPLPQESIAAPVIDIQPSQPIPLTSDQIQPPIAQGEVPQSPPLGPMNTNITPSPQADSLTINPPAVPVQEATPVPLPQGVQVNISAPQPQVAQPSMDGMRVESGVPVFQPSDMESINSTVPQNSPLPQPTGGLPPVESVFGGSPIMGNQPMAPNSGESYYEKPPWANADLPQIDTGITSPFMGQAPVQTQAPVVDSSEPIQYVSGSQLKEHKNRKSSFAIWGLIIGFIILILLAVGGFFGYYFYTKYTESQIVKKALTSLVGGSGLAADYEVGDGSFSILGKFGYDTKKNVLFSMSIPGSGKSLNFYYFNSTDRGYIEIPNQNGSILGYVEYKNVMGSINNAVKNQTPACDYSKIIQNAGYAESKFLTRLQDESFDGKSLYRFSFEPTKDFLDSECNSKAKSESEKIEALSMDMWIDRGTSKFYQITVRAKSPKTQTSGAQSKSSGETQNLVIKLKFTDPKGEISLPQVKNIIQTFDMKDLIEQLQGQVSGANTPSA